MSDLVILWIEDEPDVRSALVRDLEPLAQIARIEETDSAEDARAAVEELDRNREEIALILADHRLPGDSGVDLLVELAERPVAARAKRALVTGQAGHADTIRAINEGNLDFYVAKPWEPDHLRSAVRALLTDWVIEQRGNPLPYLQQLDGPRLLDAFGRRTSDF